MSGDDEDSSKQEPQDPVPDIFSQRFTALVVGHYCHDRITLPGGSWVDALGGSVSYIVNVFEALRIRAKVVSKVGPDFLYAAEVSHSPQIVANESTTEFFSDFTSGERSLKVGRICEPIFPQDIPSGQRYDLGLVVGVAGEVSPKTLGKVAENSRILVADIQALIRTIDSETGVISLCKLADTPFLNLLSGITYLKAARNEAVFIDIEQVRQITCLIVTEGRHGSRVYSKERDFRVPAFPVSEVDPTGAGDSFLAGFSAGIHQGMSVYQAVLTGNYFGALAVEQIGVPRFTEKHLQDCRTCVNFCRETSSQRFSEWHQRSLPESNG